MAELARSEFILGGQRSGKSRRAEELARQWMAADTAHRAVLIATGQAWDEEMRERIARHQADRAARERYAQLSEREREVLGFIVAGLTNKEIGRALNLSPRTVESHRANLFAKLQAESLAQLIRHYAALVDADGQSDTP